MAQVKFLQGTQQALNGLSSYTQGAFYLTTDSQRLYYAKASNDLIPLNQFIRTIATTDDLPATAEEGDYYYIRQGNILCIKDRQAATGWVQLNPDHYYTLDIANSQQLSVGDTVTNGVVIEETIADTANNSITGSVTLKGSDAVTISNSVANPDEITISAPDTTYAVGTAAATGMDSTKQETGAKVTLTSTKANDNSDITIKSANGHIGITQSGNVITLTGGDQSVTKADLNADRGVFQVLIDNTTTGDTITPTLKYGQNATASATFNGGSNVAVPEATLNVYTTDEVDDAIEAALSAADAMTYMGTVGSADAASKLTTNAPWGSVYKASSDISTPVAAKLGDLIIAEKAAGFTGEEGDANSTTWVVVSSGDDQAITFSSDGTTGEVFVTDNVNTAGIKVAAGTHVAVTHTEANGIVTSTVGQAADYTAQTATGSAAAVTQTAASSNTATTNTFTAVTAISTDAYGNVVDGSIQTQTLTVTDSHANISSVETGVSTAASGVDVEIQVTDTDNVTQDGSFNISSDNSCLAVTKGVGASDVVLTLNWGTF